MIPKFRRMRERSWSNFWVLCWAQHNTHYVGFLVMLASWPESAKSLGNSQIPDSRSQHNYSRLLKFLAPCKSNFVLRFHLEMPSVSDPLASGETSCDHLREDTFPTP